MSNPLVIGHRGACGYRPENTLESFALAFQQGVTTIEFDLVSTKDAALIIRHENELSRTTDISSRPEFADLARWGELEGESVEGWFSEDLTLAQIKSLRAIERMPVRRPLSATCDGQFEIPSFDELLADPMVDGKTLIVEIKDGTHVSAIDTNMGELVADEIAVSRYAERNINFVIESFSIELLRQAKIALVAHDISAKYFLPIDGDSITYAEIESLAQEFDGISIGMPMLRESPQVVEQAQRLALPVYVFTARIENAKESVAKYFDSIISCGVDGIFADQPDLLLRHLGSAESRGVDSGLDSGVDSGNVSPHA